MAESSYLVDASVLARAPQELVGERLETLARDGRLWTCRMLDLEVVYGSRARDLAAVIEERFALPCAEITPAVVERAVRVAGMMAGAGLHRGAKPVDLIVAAAAEAAGVGVLHYDEDFDRIATVTGQETEWVADRGALEW